MNRAFRRATGVLAALLLACSLAGCGGDSSPRPPRPLPDITLQPLRTTDKAVALGDLRGPMVVNLWAQWCGPCRDELPYYRAFHAKHPEIPLLGVDWLDPRKEKAVAYAKKAGLTYPMVTDPDKQVSTRGIPTLILLDERGRVVYRQPIEITSLAQLEGLVRKHLGVTL